MTGYKVVGPPYRPGVSGPLTVGLNRQAAVQLAMLIRALPPGRGPNCHEPVSKVYKVAVPLSAGGPESSVIGYRCAAAVRIVTGATHTWQTDSGYRLISEVRRLLPATARGTQHESVGCK